MMQVDDNVVYVGNKPVAAYIAAIMALFEQGHKEVVIQARGKNSLNAMRVYLVAKNKLHIAKGKEIEIDEEDYQSNGRTRKVPTISIKLVKE